MNKGLIFINIILLVAVAVLFFLFFKNSNGNYFSQNSEKSNESMPDQKNFRVAYFDMDSIEANFSLFKTMQKEIAKKEDSMNSVMNSARMNLQSKYRKYQEQRSMMTPYDIEQASNELSKMDMEIKNNEQSLNQAFQSFYMNKQQEVISIIKKYCLEFNKSGQYSFIISNEPGLIYYKDTAYNITGELLKGLNEIYNTPNKK